MTPEEAQYDLSGAVDDGDWMLVEIMDGGVGSGDRVRIRLLSESEVLGVCGAATSVFPGLVYDGNFNIRSK